MYLYLLSVSIILGTVSAISKNATYYPPENAAIYFEEFIITYGKQYVNEQERAKRLEIFKDNLEKINRLNKESKHAVFGITNAMDLTNEEFIKTHTGLGELQENYYCTINTDFDIPNYGSPESLDYRTMGYVTRVKDQNPCGCCYAFSAIGHIEGQYAKTHGSLQEFSEQQILDCDKISRRCDGGWPSASFKELIRMGGLMTEAQYPYTRTPSQCRVNPSKIAVKVVDCASYHLTREETLKQLLYQVGPISIGIKSAALHVYNGGILHNYQCTGDVNHAALLVGYGSENGLDYWIIKNSWGVNRGEQGYVRVERNGSPVVNGPCGILHPWMATATVA